MSDSADRYRNFPFLGKWNGRYVAGFSEVSPLPVDLKSTRRRESGGPPPALGPEGQGTPFFINLERGVSFDLGFQQWVNMVRSFGPATGKGSLLPEYKRPFTIEVCDEHGNVVYAYHLSNCWVTGYSAVPSADTSTSEVTIEHLRLGFEQWVREPKEK
jgi:phage tail-like protein|nr:phage tail protein [uncultured Methanoregula sp.]